MRHILGSLGVIVLTSIVPVRASAQQQEIENVAAFARLYGVARWFYPGDAAAAIDWNRFATHGVSRVRGARTPAALEATLEELFAPLGPGIAIGTTLPPKPAPGKPDASLIAWRYRGAAMAPTARGPYSAKRTNRSAPAPAAQGNLFAHVAQVYPAATLHGATIRLRARVRIADPNAQGWAGLWLRVDRGQQQGFFDNMYERPVRDTAWREYVIEGTVATDATRIVFGALTSGAMSADVDAIELAVRSDLGTWSPLPIADASFEAAAPAPGTWSQNGMQGAYTFSRPASGAADGQRFLRITAATGTTATGTTAAGASQPPVDAFETPLAGAFIDVQLARGLQARVPLSLTDAEARVPSVEPAALAALRTFLTTFVNPWGRDDADVRLADAVVAWNVFRHFYPYWSDIEVDWDARLGPQLQTALDAPTTREGHHDALRALVADVHDGHGNVREVARPLTTYRLPLQFRILGERLLVTASGDSAVPAGSLVNAIDGVPASERVAKEVRLASGTSQWRKARAQLALAVCRTGSDVRLTVEPPRGASRQATLACNAGVAYPAEPRPDSIAQLQPGIWYVDLTRVRATQLREVVDKLASARGVVFDVRGYPTDIGFQLIPHLVSSAEGEPDSWMHVSRIAQPFGVIDGWSSQSWRVQPATPHVAVPRVFLTDGRAISYAESVMGYVRDHKLGTIVGGATAGANGNIADFTVPGGFTIVFTGMRVTRHDGRTPFHMIGVTPDIPLEPTLAGIRAGRDELLERALSVLRTRP